jgi:hypothetical protein
LVQKERPRRDGGAFSFGMRARQGSSSGPPVEPQLGSPPKRRRGRLASAILSSGTTAGHKEESR